MNEQQYQGSDYGPLIDPKLYSQLKEHAMGGSLGSIGPTEAPKENILKYGMNLKDIIQDMEDNLKGIVYDDNKKEYTEKINKDNRITDEGVQILMALPKIMLTRAFTQSNYTTKHISESLIALAEIIIQIIGNHYDEYNIPRSKFDYVFGIIMEPTEATLLRALEGKDRDLIPKVEKIIERHIEGIKEQGGIHSLKNAAKY